VQFLLPYVVEPGSDFSDKEVALTGCSKSECGLDDLPSLPQDVSVPAGADNIRIRLRRRDRPRLELIQMIEAARLIGVVVIVSGLSAAVSKALVDLKFELSALDIVGDLQSGVESPSACSASRSSGEARPSNRASSPPSLTTGFQRRLCPFLLPPKLEHSALHRGLHDGAQCLKSRPRWGGLLRRPYGRLSR
jgi:hypothetical protein